MPIYEFECPDCGAESEQLCAAGTERIDCPECGRAEAERKISSFALSRQLTANQRRRLEDKRGTNRDGAKQRFKRNLERARRSAPPKPPRAPGGGAE